MSCCGVMNGLLVVVLEDYIWLYFVDVDMFDVYEGSVIE